MSSSPDEPHSGRRLTSWKEIASYLGRDVRTVQRWEKKEGLPVHRHVHESRSSVYVETGELDDWLACRAITAVRVEPVRRFVPRPRFRQLAALIGVLAMAVPLVSVWKVVRDSRDDGSIRMRRLLARTDIDKVGAASWDGRFVPYRNNQAELWLYNVATAQSRRVMDRPAARSDFRNFLLSPDGSQLAYVLESLDRPGQLRLRNVDESEERVLLTDPKYSLISPESWSTDGRSIAAVLWESDDVRDIAVINVADGAFRMLYNIRGSSGQPLNNAQFSPDGRYVAYNESRDIFVVPSGGGPPIGAVVHPSTDSLIGWAPDGRLVFTSDRAGRGDIWAVEFHDGKAPEPKLLSKALGISPRGITKAGDLFFTQSSLVNDLYTAELDASGRVLSPPARLTDTRYQGKNRSPDYSRDGKLLAYISGQDDSSAVGIRIRTLATGEERELPMPMPRIDQLRWYPDGSALLIRGGFNTQKYGFFRLDLNDTEDPLTPVLTEGVPNHLAVNPTFSPDGEYLYYLALPSKDLRILMRLTLATGARREVLRPKEGFLRMYSLSPDGNEVVYDARQRNSSRDQLYLASASGGQSILLFEAESARGLGGLAWADTTTVLFERPDPYGVYRGSLLRLALQGGPSENLATIGPLLHIAVHRDGRHVTLETQGASAELSVIQNLFTQPRLQ